MKIGLLPQYWRFEIVTRSLSTVGPKVMLCVWWNFEGVIHWDFVPNGRAVDADFYSQQLERVHDILSRRYPALSNQNRVILLKDIARSHSARRTMTKIQELGGIILLSRPASYAFRLPSVSIHRPFLACKNFRKHWSCGRDVCVIKLIL